MLNARKLVLTLLALVAFSSTAAAIPVTFTTRAAFDAASAGSPRFDENFQSFATDVSFVAAPVNVNGNFTIQQVNLAGVPNTFRNIIDAPPFLFAEGQTSTYVSAFVNGGETAIDLTFSTPVFAFGADFYGIQGPPGSEGLVMDLFTPGGTLFATLTPPMSAAAGSFFGFVNTSQAELIGRIRFRALSTIPGGLGEGFGFDNAVGVRPGGPTAIPEPATMVLLGIGLTGVAGAVRRHRKANKG